MQSIYFLDGRLEFHFNSTPPALKDISLNNPNVQKGGFYHPPDCVARSRIAFIIPHRARELHLRALLWHIHPIFQRQQLYYKVYVVHQVMLQYFRTPKQIIEMGNAFRELTFLIVKANRMSRLT